MNPHQLNSTGAISDRRPVVPPRAAARTVPVRRVLALASVAVASATLVACSSSGSAVGGQSGNTPAVTTSSSDAGAVSSPTAGSAASLVPTRFRSGVTVATSAGYPPTDFTDSSGKVTGFDYDLGQALSKQLGIPFNFKETTFAAIIPSILAKKFDLVMDDMNDSKAREQQMTFVDYFSAGRSLVVPKAEAGSIHGLTDLCGKTVAVTQGTANADVAEQASATCKKAGKSGITVNQLQTGADDLLQLASHKADAQVDDSNTAGYSVLQSKGNLVLVPLKQLPAGVAGIGMLRANSDLAKAIQAGMRELIANGTYKQILDKYGLADDAVNAPTIDGATS